MTDRNVPDARRNRLDFWQAASGALLALFVCVHLMLEGTVVLSASLTNAIAWLLEATFVAQISAPIIVLLVVFHFYIAARKMPFRAVNGAMMPVMGNFCHSVMKRKAKSKTRSRIRTRRTSNNSNSSNNRIRMTCRRKRQNNC